MLALPATSPPPLIRLMIGLTNAPVNAVTTAVKATPITIPTARSITLPRMMKSLKPLSIDPPRRAATLRPRPPARIPRPAVRWRSPRVPGARVTRERCRLGTPGLAGVLFDMDGTLVDRGVGTSGRSSFDAVVAGDEVDETKPHPVPYLTAAALLGVDVRRCVAIEDSPTGVASALAAGAVVLAVPAEVDLSTLAGVTLVASLAEVDLPFLARLVDGR